MSRGDGDDHLIDIVHAAGNDIFAVYFDAPGRIVQ